MSCSVTALLGWEQKSSSEKGLLSFPKPREAIFQSLTHSNKLFHWAQMAALISAIGGATIFSYRGILPASYFTVAKISLLSFGLSLAVSATIERLVPNKTTKIDENTYGDLIQILPPLFPCILIPLLEELFFRQVFQGSLAWLFPHFLPQKIFPLFGHSLLLSQAAAITSAALVFGIAHAFNDHKKAYKQAIACLVCGFSLGFVYTTFGLLASSFSHAFHNSLCILVSKLLGKTTLWNIQDVEEHAAANLGSINQRSYLFFPTSYATLVEKMQKIAKERKFKKPRLIIDLQYSSKHKAFGEADRLYRISSQKTLDFFNSWRNGYFFNCHRTPRIFVIDGGIYRIPKM
jgi:membrane protease YdiL (CAAX protease family)